MKHFVIWDAISMAWSEVGLAPSDYPKIAAELRADYSSWDEVSDVVFRDVIGSFALESCLMPLAIVPIIGMFLITPFPDWGYEEAYLRERMHRWYSVPRWRHYLNPLRLVGYPLALLFAFSISRRLKAAYRAVGPTS